MKIKKIEMKKEKTQQGPMTETCVLCHKDTGISKNAPVASRFGYVEGAGQLCPSCYARICTSEIY